MKPTTLEESVFNELAQMEADLQRHLRTANANGHDALAVMLGALIAQINIAKATALDAAGKPGEVVPK